MTPTLAVGALAIAALLNGARLNAQVSNIRPADQSGINVFEAPKNDTIPASPRRWPT